MGRKGVIRGSHSPICRKIDFRFRSVESCAMIVGSNSRDEAFSVIPHGSRMVSVED